MKQEFEPKLVSVLREGIPRKQLVADITAGIIVGVVALPLAIAFAIASGVKPEQGLYTAIVAGLIISLLSGSRVQIGGPTGAFVVLVFSIMQKYGYDGLATATLMAGVMLVVMGFARLGRLIQFIPYPVTIGFTSGIALIIASGQIRDFLGLQIASSSPHFVEKLIAIAEHLSTINFTSLCIAVATVLILLFLPKLTTKLPGSMVALVVTTLVVSFFKLPVDTIGSRFGGVPSTFPMPHLPTVEPGRIGELILPALSIALLAGIESLLSAVVADGMTGRRHRSNMELVAQGFANIASPLFGGIPATGAIARTATNVRSGAATPIAGIVHALTLLVILLVAGPLASKVPLATLAGILMVVAVRMSEYHLFAKVLKSTRGDAAVLLTTFLLTVFVDLTVAVPVGIVLAAFLFVNRMVALTHIRELNSDDEPERPELEEYRDLAPAVAVYEIKGTFFFGAAHKFITTLDRMQSRPRVVVLDLADVTLMDVTGLRALEDIESKTRREGNTLILCGLHSEPRKLLESSGMLERLGAANVVKNLEAGAARSREVLGGGKLGANT